MLRLPTGIFYAQGVKANVLLFERKAASKDPATKELWVYDFRTNQHFTLKTKAMKRPDLDQFVAAVKPGRPLKERVESEQFKCWTYEQLAERDGLNLDIWADVKDESLTDANSLPAPEVIAEEIVEHLSAALEQFQTVAAELGGNGAGVASEVSAEEAAQELLPDETI